MRAAVDVGAGAGGDEGQQMAAPARAKDERMVRVARKAEDLVAERRKQRLRQGLGAGLDRRFDGACGARLRQRIGKPFGGIGGHQEGRQPRKPAADRLFSPSRHCHPLSVISDQ